MAGTVAEHLDAPHNKNRSRGDQPERRSWKSGESIQMTLKNVTCIVFGQEQAKTLMILHEIENWLGGRDSNPDAVVQRAVKWVAVRAGPLCFVPVFAVSASLRSAPFCFLHAQNLSLCLRAAIGGSGAPSGALHQRCNHSRFSMTRSATVLLPRTLGRLCWP
jgi:hypothetical protein